MNWLKSTFCIVRLNVDNDAKLTDGGNPFHTLTMRSAKKNFVECYWHFAWRMQQYCQYTVRYLFICMWKINSFLVLHIWRFQYCILYSPFPVHYLMKIIISVRRSFGRLIFNPTTPCRSREVVCRQNDHEIVHFCLYMCHLLHASGDLLLKSRTFANAFVLACFCQLTEQQISMVSPYYIRVGPWADMMGM